MDILQLEHFLAVCEEGIGHARETMNEVIAGYVSNKKPR